jgi:hypothetical protein
MIFLKKNREEQRQIENHREEQGIAEKNRE